MSQIKGQSRVGRIARLAATIVSVVLVLPSLAVADHTSCNKQANDVGAGINCPEFSPEYNANVSNQVVDSESDISWEISQAAHESQLMRLALYTPDTWQFNTQLRPAAVAGACTGSATRISINGWGLAVNGTLSRGDAYFDQYDAVTQTITGCARIGSNQIPFSLVKEPDASAYGWKLSIDLKNNAAALGSGSGLGRVIVELAQRTDLSWHQNQSGQFERAVFSQASETPTVTDLRAELTACRRGLDNSTTTGCRGDALLTVTRTMPATRIAPAPTVAPMDFARLTGPSRIAGTTAEKQGAVRRDGFGLVEGSTTANATFTQPAAHPDETVKGYALVIAIPGNQGSRSGKYVVTKVGQPGFDAAVCGPSGTGPCSIPLVAGSLPRVDGSGSLHPDFDAGGGKYDLSLVTIFMSGKRSDGLCDDGTPFGSVCSASTPLWQFRGTSYLGNGCAFTAVTLPANAFGISTWQFLWRTHNYASVSVERQSDFNFESGPTGCRGDDDESEPFMLLFVDYAAKQAEFVIYGGWTYGSNTAALTFVRKGNSGDGPATAFLSRDNRIIGDGGIGSVQFTNGASPTGTGLRFDFAGETDAGNSRGTLTLLDPGDVNLGSTLPPNPTGHRPMRVATEVMQGVVI